MLLATFELSRDTFHWQWGFFFTGSQAAFFGPTNMESPELLPEKRLSWGNGIRNDYLLSIILGTVVGAILWNTCGSFVLSWVDPGAPGASGNSHQSWYWPPACSQSRPLPLTLWGGLALR
jgi:hypothetical protein